MIDARSLVRALWQRTGGNVVTRVLSRTIELARLVILAEQCLRAVVPDAPCAHDTVLPMDADAFGLRAEAWATGCRSAAGALPTTRSSPQPAGIFRPVTVMAYRARWRLRW